MASTNSSSVCVNEKTTTKQDATKTETVGTLIRPARKTMIFSGILTAVSALLGIMPYIAITQMALAYESKSTVSVLWTWTITAVVCLVLSRLFYVYGLAITHQAEANLRYSLRRRLINGVARGPLGRILSLSPGRIRKNICDDTNAIHALIAHYAGDVTYTITIFIAASIYLFIVNWTFTLLLLAIWTVLFIAVLGTAFRGYGKITADFAEKQTQLAEATSDLIDGIQEIKNFQTQYFGQTRFNEKRQEFSDLSYRWTTKVGKRFAILMGILQPAGVLLIVAPLGVLFVALHWSTPAEMIAFFTLGLGLPSGLITMFILMQSLYRAQLAVKLTAEFLSVPPLSAPAQASPVLIEACHDLDDGRNRHKSNYGRIVFRDVSFSYEKDETVLEHVNAVFEPGTVNALVGASGGGKTTIAMLIARFFDVTSGSVSVNGVNVRDFPQELLLQQMGIVFQDVNLIHDTVANNISLGNSQASREEIIKAAQSARIHDRIMSLPDQYDTVLGQSHSMLSGGEKQRLSLARIFLQKAPIIILDEATAQSDPHSEKLIHQALSQLCRNRTVIIIAHRLTTIQYADAIFVVDHKTIREQGTHSELLRQKGMYARMWQEQYCSSDKRKPRKDADAFACEETVHASCVNKMSER